MGTWLLWCPSPGMAPSRVNTTAIAPSPCTSTQARALADPAWEMTRLPARVKRRSPLRVVSGPVRSAGPNPAANRHLHARSMMASALCWLSARGRVLGWSETANATTHRSWLSCGSDEVNSSKRVEIPRPGAGVRSLALRTRRRTAARPSSRCLAHAGTGRRTRSDHSKGAPGAAGQRRREPTGPAPRRWSLPQGQVG
jgi:hypothetical protein